MKILIIGGAGYIGSVLTEYFLNNGHDVLILDLLRRGSEGIIKHIEKPNFQLINVDFISKFLSLTFKSYEIDIVIHLAAVVGDPACAKEPELAKITNYNGVQYLINECNKHDVKMFFASTCSVYGYNEHTCDEHTLLNPQSHYAQTKAKAERYITNYSLNGLIFRFGTMYGVSPNMRYDLVVNRLVESAVKSSHFSVFDGTQFRPFLHPKDLARFFMSLFDKDLSGYVGETFNLVSENLSMLELGELIERTIPTAIMKLVPEKEDNRSYICRSFKANKELGFSPQIRVRDGIQEIEKELLKVKGKIRNEVIT